MNANEMVITARLATLYEDHGIENPLDNAEHDIRELKRGAPELWRRIYDSEMSDRAIGDWAYDFFMREIQSGMSLKNFAADELEALDKGGTNIPHPIREAMRVNTFKKRPRHSVADFNTLDDLLQHARREGATHYLQIDDETHIYFRRKDGQYEKAEVWQKDGYWHTQGPGSRVIVRQPPANAKAIGGRAGVEAPRREMHAKRDRRRDQYVYVDDLRVGDVMYVDSDEAVVVAITETEKPGYFDVEVSLNGESRTFRYYGESSVAIKRRAPTSRELHAARRDGPQQATKPGKHGTLKLWLITYTDADNPAFGEDSYRTWAYDKQAAWDAFNERVNDEGESWEIVKIDPVIDSGPQRLSREQDTLRRDDMRPYDPFDALPEALQRKLRKVAKTGRSAALTRQEREAIDRDWIMVDGRQIAIGDSSAYRL